MKVSLPFPNPKLNPNKKNGKHWIATFAIKSSSRELAKALTRPKLDLPEHIPLSVIFNPPDKRHRDLDNLLASCKPYIDGIAEGLGINDKRFRPILIDYSSNYDNTVDFYIGELKWK